MEPLTLWIVFENNCPECGRYNENDLDFLSQSLTHWDADHDTETAIKQELLALDLGVMKVIGDKLVVKVTNPKE